MRSLIIAMMLFIVPVAVHAQQDAAEAVMNLYDMESVEMLDPYEVERLEAYVRRPLKINLESLSRLEESGLFTHYQIMSLSDYRERHGDVMSFSELSAVDGFGQDFVRKVSPFISLVSYSLPSGRSVRNRKTEHELCMKTAVRSGAKATYGLKYRIDIADRLDGSLSASRTSDSRNLFSGSLMLRFRKMQGCLVIGDYNARFGQGLALWNGMNMGGIPAPSTLMKRPSGITASSSFTGNYALRGMAGNLMTGKMKLSALLAFSSSEKGFKTLPGANASFFLRNGQISLTHYAELELPSLSSSVEDMKTSADISLCLKGTDLFAETAYDWKSGSLAFLTGCVFSAGNDVRTGVTVRAYPSDYSSVRSAALRSLTKCSNEYSLSLSTEYSAGRWIDMKDNGGFRPSARQHAGVVSIDAAYLPVPKEDDIRSLQFKVRADYSIHITDSWVMKVRLSERIRTWDVPFRSEVRSDVIYDSGIFSLTMRMNAVKCVGWSFLTYSEASYAKADGAAFIRFGLFRADDWEDRIYAYERDAPGSFNVPAYYGRGVWTALTFRWRFARWGKVYLRAAATSYVLMEEEKPGKAELKLQLEFDL